MAAIVPAGPIGPVGPRRSGVEAEAVLGKAYDVRLMRRIATYVRPHVRLLIAWVGFMLVRLGLELAQPALLVYALTHHIMTGDAAALPLDGLGYVGLVIGQNLMTFVEQWMVQLAGQRTMHDLRISIFDHVLAQRAAFFDKIPVGRLMTRMTNDIESLNEIFSQGAITIVGDALKAIAIVGIMLYLDVQLSLMTFITLPLLFVIVEYARRAMRTSFRQIRVRLAAMNGFAQEHLFGIRVVQLLGRATIAQREYDEINAGHRDAYLPQIRADAAMYALVEAIGYIAIGGVMWWAAGHHAQDVATIGLVVLFIEYIGRFFEPLRELSAKYAVMQGAMAASERIFQLLDTDERDGEAPNEAMVTKPEAREPVRVTRASELAGGIVTTPAPATPAVELAGVHFSYGAEPVLRGIDVRVPRGATVAVVGATGSGKSTVIKLLTRLYERDRGAIRIDGVDVRDLALGELRRRITVVSQDVILFAGTLADNIALGKPFGVPALDAAVHRVGLDRALVRRGSGLDTPVAERGANFSAGERQLVAFARALLRDPEILILDEATAHVDPEAEELIERGVAELMKGRTTLVIAHRLSTIRNADLIVVMDKGLVVEQGTHDELIARGGMYAALERTFRRQPEVSHPT
ncbi:MAG TPA: ABC transporter ATP-binding protein [Kofleriaceae bacterium]|jgi:ATP-binding cassette subfamily B protein|nr:ABC transporter ATP-binding protein [Kofleriaceae bacterium]